MLLQSHGDEVHILPALPAAWPDGRVSGLRARGDLTVDIAWSAGTAREITVTAGKGGDITLRCERWASDFRLTEELSGRTAQVVRKGESVTFSASPSVRYRLSPA
ncbi:glycoside hydrolase family 95-like protein [Paractinoplanes durhamensis]